MSNENMTNTLYENFNAMMKSGQIWAQGLTEISKTFANMAHSHLEANMAMVKALTNSKNTQEALDIQTDYIKKSADKTMSDSKNLSDTTQKLAHESMIPGKTDGINAGQKQRAM